jgi:hypothetical protein
MGEGCQLAGGPVARAGQQLTFALSAGQRLSVLWGAAGAAGVGSARRHAVNGRCRRAAHMPRSPPSTHASQHTACARTHGAARFAATKSPRSCCCAARPSSASCARCWTR